MKKYRKFIDLSKKNRKKKVFSLKNEIRNNKEEYHPKFISHQMIEEPDRPVEFNQWLDFYFLSKRKDILWNACIITTKKKLWDAVSEQAWDEASSLLTSEELQSAIRIEWFPASFYRGKPSTYTAKIHRPAFEKLGGLTLMEYKRNLESEIITTRPPKVYEHYKINKKYAYGLGLDIVVDVPHIDMDVVEMAIDRFMNLGEKNWTASDPATPTNLIFEQEDIYYQRIHPRLLDEG